MHTIILERRGYANYLQWVMVVSGLFIYDVDSVPICYILGYDVPTCGSRVPFIHIVYVSLLFPFMMLLVDS